MSSGGLRPGPVSVNRHKKKKKERKKKKLKSKMKMGCPLAVGSARKSRRVAGARFNHLGTPGEFFAGMVHVYGGGCGPPVARGVWCY